MDATKEATHEASPVGASPLNDHPDSEGNASDGSPGDNSTNEDSQDGDVSDHSLDHVSTDEAFPDDEVPSDLSADQEPSDGSEPEDDYEEEPLIYPTCGLCRFYFEPGDPVCIFEPESWDLSPLWKGVYTTPWTEPRDLGEQAFHIICLDIIDSRIDIWNNPMLHIIIRQMSRVSGTLSRPIEPPKSLASQRDRWLRNAITEDLQHVLKGRLPTEICQTIASYCTKERATQIIRDVWLGRIQRTENFITIPIDDQFPLWVSYVNIEGFRYVASISCSRQSQSDELLFSPEDYAGPSFNIYFAEDSRGIRRIVIRESDTPPSIYRGAGLRWVICCLHQKVPFCLQWKSDSVKLRGLDVTSNEEDSPDWDLRRWASLPRDLDTFPQPPAVRDAYDQKNNYSDGIQAIDWNAPGIRGYYFYFDTEVLRGILAVNSQDSRTSHVDEFSQRGNSGIFFPIDHGERVSELWIRTGDCDVDGLPIKMETLIVCLVSFLRGKALD
ncbi:hypothetical protein NW768_002892 [Fusarium equiseti]|uniref:Uncharacterized protein n=1 Tax=Fusarium equiseti TaxID=61235 RepID=A0ABQ8RKJ6_FUSEQ|nr:hypothetical protein NW768_002892 [Fusarium equiseti]